MDQSNYDIDVGLLVFLNKFVFFFLVFYFIASTTLPQFWHPFHLNIYHTFKTCYRVKRHPPNFDFHLICYPIIIYAFDLLLVFAVFLLILVDFMSLYCLIEWTEYAKCTLFCLVCMILSLFCWFHSSSTPLRNMYISKLKS
jgi:hypothetical protein